MKSSFRQLVRRTLLGTVPRGLLFDRGSSKAGRLYLTFDDGPHPEHTPRVLDVLAAYDAKATFFVIGEKAEQHPEIVQRIVAEGHALGNHTWSHCSLQHSTSAQAVAEMRETCDLIFRITGKRMRLFRPPHGKVTAGQLLRLWLHRQTVVLWNVDPKDYECQTANAVLSRLKSWQPRGGDVLLFHDRLAHTADAVQSLLDNLRRLHPDLSPRSLSEIFDNRTTESVIPCPVP